MSNSKSTDKLGIISTIIDKLLSDETMKSKVKTVKIEWKNIQMNDEDYLVVPELTIEMQ